MQDVGIDQIGPFLHERWLVGAAALINQSLNRRLQGQRIKTGEDRSDDIRQGSLIRRMQVAYPTKFPSMPPQGLKGIQGVSRQEAGITFPTDSPTSVNQDPSFAAGAG